MTNPNQKVKKGTQPTSSPNSKITSGPRPARKRGAPKGSRNAAKPGQYMRLELYLSKSRRLFLAEWFTNQYGYFPGEEELRETARRLATTAIDQTLWEDYQRRYPGGAGGEVF